jgi:FkbH-like protein
MTPQLYWLPEKADFSGELSALGAEASMETWRSLCALAGNRLDFTMTARLDRACQKRFGQGTTPPVETKPVRLAILGSATTEHLVPGIRVAGMRRNLWVETFTGHYGQYMQELLDPTSALHQFKPNEVLFVFDAGHFFGSQTPLAHGASSEAVLEEIGEKLKGLWRAAQEHFGCHVIQQTLLPLAPTLLGENEHRQPLSQHRLTIQLNERLHALADESGVDLLSLDRRVALDGVSAWHDPLLWNKAKQEISPLAGPVYGDLVGRILAAAQGRSAKCLVLDLDNTLWGGVIGDDGLEGIKLGQGSPAGEAFLAIQRYALGLSKCGVILAVCSKNDEANAFLPFDQHPEMPLKRSDIACFVANWDDKASNLREIARRLNIGIDSLVFVDDNPFERNQVRKEVPTVAVPELPEDPALYPRCLADAGYFEMLRLTTDDLNRAEQYQVNLKREEFKRSASDMDGYLESLQMELHWSPFTPVDLQRVVQLINKTNQFNLTTRRYTEAEVVAVLKDPGTSTLQLRLLDRFGDNGIIAVLIGRTEDAGTLFIDTWLMSCRVLGRGVEEATLELIVNEARRLGAHQIVGEYRPTAKNGMVSGHYAKLGFSPLDDSPEGMTRWKLDTKDFSPAKKSLISAKSIL